VLAVCRTLLRDPTEAEDAFQATFLAAFNSLLKGTVPLEPGAWLAAIARNECWGRVRARMREPLAGGEPEEAEGGTDPLAAAIRNEDVSSFWAAFSQLPGPQREAFLLREFRGLSYDELALALGVSGAAVESLLFRARRGLRAALASVAAFPLGLRDLLERLGPSAVTTGVGVKAATATVGIGLVAVTAAGLQSPHHAARAPAAARVVHTQPPRAAVHEAAAAPAAPAGPTSAARLHPRPELAAWSARPATAPAEAPDGEPSPASTPMVEPGDGQPGPAQESAPAAPTREEAVASEEQSTPSGETHGDGGHTERDDGSGSSGDVKPPEDSGEDAVIEAHD